MRVNGYPYVKHLQQWLAYTKVLYKLAISIMAWSHRTISNKPVARKFLYSSFGYTHMVMPWWNFPWAKTAPAATFPFI